MRRQIAKTIGSLAVAVLTFTACGSEDEPENSASVTLGTTQVAAGTTAAPTQSTKPEATVPTPSTTTPVPVSTTAPANPTFIVSYLAGKVEGGGRKQVAKGQTVVVRVTADIVDELHLHGYDKSVNTIANQPVELTFKAEASGVYEIELERKRVKLLEIEVR